MTVRGAAAAPGGLLEATEHDSKAVKIGNSVGTVKML